MDSTNELGRCFERIGGYCNSAEYGKAREELDKIEPYCKTPADKARLHYSRGYINYATVSQLSALLEYRRGLREDPTDPLKLKKDCKYAVKLIKKEYAELQRVAADIVNMINLRYHEIPEENKAEVDEKTFQLLLGFHQSIRPPRIDNIILGFPKEDIFLGFGDYYAKLTGEKQEEAKRFLEEAYQITDRESFLACIRDNPNLYINGYIGDAIAYLNDESAFAVDTLDEDEKLCFLAKAEFVKSFANYLPDAGVIAWDMSRQIGLTRLAFACDMINEEEYCHGMDDMSRILKAGLKSFEEYARSFIFGSALFFFKVKSMNINKATDFMFSIFGYLDMSDLRNTKWMK